MHKRNIDDDDAKLAPNSKDKIKGAFIEGENKDRNPNRYGISHSSHCHTHSKGEYARAKDFWQRILVYQESISISMIYLPHHV